MMNEDDVDVGFDVEIVEKLMYWCVVDGFVSDFVNDLCVVYDGCMCDLLCVDLEWFVWDYWYVSN